jgi:hypothetical protein
VVDDDGVELPQRGDGGIHRGPHARAVPRVDLICQATSAELLDELLVSSRSSGVLMG